MNKRQAKKHARWLAAGWTENCMLNGFYLHCPTCDDEDIDRCADCIRIEDAIEALCEELLSGNGVVHPPIQPTKTHTQTEQS